MCNKYLDREQRRGELRHCGESFSLLYLIYFNDEININSAHNIFSKKVNVDVSCSDD